MMARAGLSGLGPSALTLGMFALIVLAAAATFSWQLPVLGFAERWLHDFRTGAFAPVAAPHPRIMIAAIDEETLARTRRRSPLDRALLARAVDALDGAHPLAIGIDVLIDQPTTPADDALLTDTLRAARTPTVLAYADVVSSGGRVRDWQVDHLRDFIHGLLDGAVERASIVLPADADGTLRRTPDSLPDGTPPFALALARHAGVERDLGRDAGVPIVYRRGAVDDIPFTMVPLHILADLPARAVREVVGDKIVMIGSVLDDVDRHRTPFSALGGESMPGIAIHAQILDLGP